jgi:chemotaxis protein CheZ
MSEDEQASYLTDEYISRLNDLGDALKSGEDVRANHLIGELTTLRESSLFKELGKLTREIHDSLNAFGADERVIALTQEDIPDAKERLNFIITKTDDAAHRTMEGAEAILQEVDEFNQKAGSIQQRWAQFRTKELSKADFLALSDDMDKWFLSVAQRSENVKKNVTDIMMAQDYQDLTGQMIKQVITMVKEVEEKMVRLIAISGATMKDETPAAPKDSSKPVGPQLPTADKLEVATNQDEVDDLLASLGF